MKIITSLLFLLLIGIPSELFAQVTNDTEEDDPFSGLHFRSIGPAFMSGRIADIDIHPTNENIWYVAVGSGGVWKTINSGTTWTPIFDKESSYSIGTVTIDPNNTETIWVGAGEDIGGRHVGYGDGVYKSEDGGSTWKNMGLKKSEHISRILVHPENSDVVWVTAQGPLWSKGGERGLYKSTDGGTTWTKTLGDNEWTGVTELVMDPSQPDMMYAATWQRHRTVAAYMGGGPGTALHKSTDGGTTWTKLTNGLPTSWMGKTGLAMSPFDSNVLYAALELDRRTGGLYRSDDAGGSWTKQSDAITGGTGPHYYQELYASPHQEGKLYLMDNTVQISDDGGKTFYRMNEKNKHGDSHAIAFKNNDPNYLIMGTDGGLYESFDLTDTWKYVENLPLTQFYKVAVDDAEPFYNIYGGTQDNSTQGGPSRTDNGHGIQNSDWRVILDWDGHQPATEPGNPNIVYGERQEGTLARIDMSTGEVIDIQPQPSENEPYERFNWDAPILVSPHAPTTIYFASQRVWKSENRGDDWTVISEDLTKNQERLTLPIMGRKQSWDAPWDVYAMSNYNTITSLAESPKQKGLLYAGTDDGRINISENGGSTWTTTNVSSISGVPATAFVNDIKADLFDANTVYMALDNHKYGDFNPYLLKSTNKGKTWTSISNGIPERTLVWRIVQDHVNKNLLFAGTEFGVYFSVNGGQQWTQLKGGLPTISFRDLAIQRRENDLVAASFGRGFYILDDYTALRDVSKSMLDQPAALFPVRDAWWYIPRSHLSFDNSKGSQGDSHFLAPNPDFGATFTYYLKDAPKLQKTLRKDEEKKNTTSDVPFPGWTSLEKEKLETEAQLMFTISNDKGEVIRRLETPAKAGINRISWDLSYPNISPITLDPKESTDEEPTKSFLAPTGQYSVSMFLIKDGNTESLAEPVSFNVKPLYESTLKGSSPQVASEFWRDYENVNRSASEFDLRIGKITKRAKAMHSALLKSRIQPGSIDKDLALISQDIEALQSSYYGNQAKAEIGEKGPTTVGTRMFAIYLGIERSTYGPTTAHKAQLNIIDKQITTALSQLESLQSRLDTTYRKLKDAGAPYVED